MQLLELKWADIYRDGGSFEAFFSTDESLNYCVCLLRSRMPTPEGLQHKYLYAFHSEESTGLKIPKGIFPIITASQEEQQLISDLEAFTQDEADDNRDVEQLRRMIFYIRKREPCFAYDPIFIQP